VRSLKTLDGHLDAVVRTGLPGAVAVAAGPGFRWERAAGFADLETRERLRPDHRFRIGSVMKVFVATIVLQLVDEGTLALDGDAGPIGEGVTVRQLLNHTSGFQDFHPDLAALFEPYRSNPAYRWELEPRAMLALAKDRGRLFPPGTGWSYSGSNYLMLGLIVEETTGRTLREELRRRIFEPLGLDATDLPDRAASASGFARGYFPPDNPLIPGPTMVDVTDLDLPFSWAGGGIASTPADVARFLQALLTGELLPARLRAEMLSTVVSDWEESDGYGLGIAEITSLMGKAESPCGAAWGHIGFSPGYTTIALASKDGHRQVVIMANGIFETEQTWEALGRLTWASYCS
jgi:D-alanyl-D-alanine carboxypeptidase